MVCTKTGPRVYTGMLLSQIVIIATRETIPLLANTTTSAMSSPAALALELRVPQPVGKGKASIENQIRALEELSAQQIAFLRPLQGAACAAQPACPANDVSGRQDHQHNYAEASPRVSQPSSGAYQALPYAAQSSAITHNYTPAFPVMEARDHDSQEVSPPASPCQGTGGSWSELLFRTNLDNFCPRTALAVRRDKAHKAKHKQQKHSVLGLRTRA